MMDNNRIFIANLSKGLIGETHSSLLGSLFVTGFELAALSRADQLPHERKDFFLYADEFHHYATDSFASILSEARKYRLCLTLAHQYLGQVPETIRDAVFGNVGSVVSFRLGSNDSNVLAREFDSEYLPNHFTALENHEILAKMLSDGRSREPFLGRTMSPIGDSYGRRENIIRRSREKYGKKRQIV